ncbi:MAG: sigma-54-dependent Fis family transcriptional regulator [Deltaproteobacteria bacterium]|nr:sigma-54-dependent Fis family transcriptional regulator [Deltaproteobacteria bacterium]
MTKQGPVASTDVHRGPARPTKGAGQAALVCAYPKPLAIPLPDSGTVVGRAWLADQGIEDTEVSSAHLRFRRVGGVLSLTDVGSSNGTWVNGEPIEANQEVRLDDGSLVRLGTTLLVARRRLLGEPSPAPPIGDMVGPFGLRAVGAAVEGLAAERPTNVLIEGETGTGKELTARAVAQAVGRPSPYVAVNVAGLAAGVFESHLFGHVAGAFSGAGQAAPGIVVAHDGGVVFLDEIGELPQDQQAKLLRLLDGGEVLAVGAERPVVVDVVVVAATNRKLEALVDQGDFRADLYARLAMMRLELPPLRDRAEDIFPIAQALRGRSGHQLPAEQCEVEAVERLLLEPWPRNVRQLGSVLEATRRRDPDPGLRLWSLQEELGQGPPAKPALTLALVEATVAACDGNVTEAARRLGVSRGKLLRMRKQGQKGEG